MRKLLFSGIFSILASSCVSLNQFVLTPLGEEPAEYTQRFVYCLPQTVLEVNVVFIKNLYIPGPYRQFSEKFLGISNYIKEERTQWELERAELAVYNEPDPQHFYSVNSIKGSFQSESYFNLTSQGLVIDPMGLISVNASLPEKKLFNIPAVLELSMKKNHKEKVDTLFKTVITDSSFVKIPILRKQKEAKTLEQKAEEAANLIIKIRKRRLKLVTGEYAVFPEGIALEKAIGELDETEREYIALFTGKIYTEKYSRSYFIIPSGEKEKIDFMKFSNTKGTLPIESVEGKYLTLEIIPGESMPFGVKEEVKDAKNTLYYRIPSTCSVRITEANNLFYDGRISVFQAGILLPLPVTSKKQ